MLVEIAEWETRSKLKPMGERLMTEEASELDAFDSVTEEEIVCLWRSLHSSGLSEGEAWDAVVVGLALEVAFERSKGLRQVEQ